MIRVNPAHYCSLESGAARVQIFARHVAFPYRFGVNAVDRSVRNAERPETERGGGVARMAVEPDQPQRNGGADFEGSEPGV